MRTQAYTTGPETKHDPVDVLAEGIAAIYAIMNPPAPTVDSLYPELVRSCRTLTDHLSAYAISADTFD